MTWRTKQKCADCPFARTGPGARLRRTLTPARWKGILHDLMNDRHFLCHKTTEETGDGSNLVCAGAIEWQDRHGVSANFVRVMERVDGIFKNRKTGEPNVRH